MLRTLTLKDFALIDELELDFGPGLNLLTGETGSGKSILVDAVALLLGGRAWQEKIRGGREAARLEAVFELRSGHPAHALLQSSGIASSAEELIVRREITAAGKNKVYLNGTLAPLQLLAQLGGQLVDIHGQHDQQALLQPRSHLDWLDYFSGNPQLLAAVRQHYQDWSQAEQQLQHIRGREQERLRQLDMLRFQQQEIAQAGLSAGLQEQLQAERHLLSHAERRSQLSAAAYELLYEGDNSLLAILAGVQRQLSSLAEIDDAIRPQLERLRETRFVLDDLSRFVRQYRDSVEADPQRLAAVEDRIEEISRLQKKYGSSVSEMLNFLQAISRQLAELEQADQRAAELEQIATRQRELYDQVAAQLAEARRRQARKLEKAVERELAELAMEKTRFGVRLEHGPPRSSGTDVVEFLVSPNPGEELKPLARIASGGELSRIILALKTLIALDDPDKTLIFDEIDSGIGGRVAETLGRKLKQLARSQQILCVTHLPQIASFADHHYLVSKAASARHTRIEARPLASAERVDEIARMLGGVRITDTTRRHAQEMLKSSRQ